MNKIKLWYGQWILKTIEKNEKNSKELRKSMNRYLERLTTEEAIEFGFLNGYLTEKKYKKLIKRWVKS